MENKKPGFQSEAEGLAAKEGEVVFKTGLWRSVTKSGKPCLNGKLAKYWVNVFNIPEVKNSKHPIARLYLKPRDTQEEGIEVVDKIDNGIGLWAATSKKGAEYLSGNTKDYFWHIYSTVQKKSPKAPDYTLCIYRKRYNKTVADVTDKARKEAFEFIQEPEEDDPWADDGTF